MIASRQLCPRERSFSFTASSFPRRLVNR
jgi:hypothetical protein